MSKEKISKLWHWYFSYLIIFLKDISNHSCFSQLSESLAYSFEQSFTANLTHSYGCHFFNHISYKICTHFCLLFYHFMWIPADICGSHVDHEINVLGTKVLKTSNFISLSKLACKRYQSVFCNADSIASTLTVIWLEKCLW